MLSKNVKIGNILLIQIVTKRQLLCYYLIHYVMSKLKDNILPIQIVTKK